MIAAADPRNYLLAVAIVVTCLLGLLGAIFVASAFSADFPPQERKNSAIVGALLLLATGAILVLSDQVAG